MLRAKLSTHPFYNVRLVRGVLAVTIGVVVVVTVVNAVRIVTLSGSLATLGARMVDAEEAADRLQGEAAQIEAQISLAEVALVTAAAVEANEIIERRAFSWSGLFEYFERTLPIDVRIISMVPRIEDDGRQIIVFGAEGRTVADLETFIEALEGAGRFTSVLATEEQTTDGGLVQAVIEGTYVPPPAFPDEETP